MRTAPHAVDRCPRAVPARRSWPLASSLQIRVPMTTLTLDKRDAAHIAGPVVPRSEPGAFDVRALLGRALAPFARVEANEAVGVLLLAATVFLLLTSYYLLKIAREPLILLG